MSEEENDSPEATEENAETGADNFVPENMDGADAPQRSGADLSLDVVMDVPVQLSLQVGRTSIQVRDLLTLVEGSVVELDRTATEPMDVLVNNKLVARGEIVVVSDNFGVRLTDVIDPSKAIAAAH